MNHSKNLSLTIAHLTVKAQDQTVISDVSFTIKPGQLHVLMGPNGSGKSSLAKALMGHPDYQVISGSITLGRHQLLSLSPDKRARLGLYLGFQQPSPLSGVSLFQLLKTRLKKGKSPLHLYRKLSSQAKSLQFPPQLLESSLNENFSGGEQKKAELLQFLHLKPRFAILDEPDAGLDIDSLKLLTSFIQASLSENTGILLITHSPRLLNYLHPQAVHILKQGCLIKTGSHQLARQIERSGYSQFQNREFVKTSEVLNRGF